MQQQQWSKQEQKSEPCRGQGQGQGQAVQQQAVPPQQEQGQGQGPGQGQGMGQGTTRKQVCRNVSSIRGRVFAGVHQGRPGLMLWFLQVVAAQLFFLFNRLQDHCCFLGCIMQRIVRCKKKCKVLEQQYSGLSSMRLLPPHAAVFAAARREKGRDRARERERQPSHSRSRSSSRYVGGSEYQADRGPLCTSSCKQS